MNRPDDDGFLSRWSRRKAAVRTGAPAPEPPAAAPATPAVSRSTATPVTGHADALQPDGSATVSQGVPAAPPPEPPPQLEDTEALTPESDFARFAKPDVDPQVRNAALKKLFADPRFNVIDEMDIDIMDYNKLEPLPQSMLRRMAQAHVLGLFDDEEDEEKAKAASAGAADPATPSAAPAPSATADADIPSPDPRAPDEDPDLRLQPDDAAGPAGDRPRAGEDAERQR
ncbi:DUF3306 domain-containing protein [Rubrivivax albus]|uniref:DUF3306 domain-containing protein n=1 Tax=Rubrivivax albus TaxID=2499835 RepID=A0A437K179_9BURK|nr:DUF3306 domain-containing protein [Rubrivivax albus]RVT54077.1 DUF3306 domain-containing protein [Rubrivivax albus]